MQREAFAALAELEDHHWWFEGRRRILASALERFNLPATSRILEAGCGSGGNLEMLSKFGKVWGMEPDTQARERAVERGFGTIEYGSFPNEVPFDGMQFDVVGLFDVLEHLEHDVAALRSLLPRFAPGGHLLISVPAFPFLFGPHDVMHEHYRRYTASMARETLEKAGYRMVRWSYFNSLFFLPAAAYRLMNRNSKPSDKADLRLTPSSMNGLLMRIMSSEGPIVSRISVPFGLSLLVVGEPMNNATSK